MSWITVLVLIFSILGIVDYLLGNKFGLGKEFERGFSLFSSLVFSSLGILVLAPAVGVWLTPVLEKFYAVFHIDPSIIPASLFASDMGAATISQKVFHWENIGKFNGYVVSTMMGCMVSYTIPVSVGIVKKEQHKDLFFGCLCGLVTIPVGCFVAGLLCGISPGALLLDLLPLLILSGIIALGLVLVPDLCIRIFSVFGKLIRCISLVGLTCAIFTFLTKRQISPHFDTLENAAFICLNGCVTLSGMLPLMYLITKLLNKPLEKLSPRIGMNSTSVVSLLTTLVSSTPVFGVMDKMNRKGVVLNSAFAVSAAFVFGAHLAFTVAFDSTYLTPMIVGKLISGICGITLAAILFKDKDGVQ